MNAQPIPPQPRSPRRARRRFSTSKQTPGRQTKPHTTARHSAIALEIAIKLSANLVFCSVAISSLVQLLPQQLSHRQNLAEVESEASVMAARVHTLRDRFQEYFDPQQSQRLIQEQTHLVDPNRRTIVWREASE